MIVTNLFIKPKQGAELKAVTSFDFHKDGISSGARCARFRQVLITSLPVLAECGLQPGDLRENVVVNEPRLYEFPSGTVIKVGEALIRLTFHCEPCRKVLHLIEFDRIVHRRGVFGCFLNDGSVRLEDELAITGDTFEPIPYELKERVKWYLKKEGAPKTFRDLIDAIGLPPSFGKALPRLIERLLPS